MTDTKDLRRAFEFAASRLHEIEEAEFRQLFEPLLAAHEEKQTSVLQPWVMRLPLRAQGALLTGIRGCDLAPKNPVTIDEKYGCSTGEDTIERQLVAYLRYCTIVPADQREVDVPGAWFKSSPPAKWKPSQLTHYPMHWYTHLMHCYEVVAYLRLPHDEHCDRALGIYMRMVEALHLVPERASDMVARFCEDRIAKGKVVS